MKKFIYLALSLVSLLSFASCGDEDEKEESKVDIPEEVSSEDYATLSDLGLNYPFEGEVLVDLGLSVKWTSKNVGALNFYDNGYYFAWGETKPKDDYSSSTSITINKSTTELIDEGIIDNNGNLTFAYDAATVKNVLYRTPTATEFRELAENCDFYKMIIISGTGVKVNGNYVKSKINGNAIFLPSAGYRMGTYSIDGCCDYTISTVNQNFVKTFDRSYEYIVNRFSIISYEQFHLSHASIDEGQFRYFGFPIRAVENK